METSSVEDMNKKQIIELKFKIKSVEETIVILHHQESNLLEAMSLHPYESNKVQVKKWVQELFIGCDYIIRLENSVNILKETLKQEGYHGGKKKD